MHMTIETAGQGAWAVRMYSQTLGTPRIIGAIARCAPPEGGVYYVCVTYLRDHVGERTTHPDFIACRTHIETTMAALLGLPPACFNPLDPKLAVINSAALNEIQPS